MLEKKKVTEQKAAQKAQSSYNNFDN